MSKLKVTVRGVTYWKYRPDAALRRHVTLQAFHDARLVEYGKGWAIQREVSGPYWNDEKGVWV